VILSTRDFVVQTEMGLNCAASLIDLIIMACSGALGTCVISGAVVDQIIQGNTDAVKTEVEFAKE